MQDGTVKAAIGLLSRLNPQSGKYEPVAKVPVVATRKSNNYVIVVLGPQQKPLTVVQVTQQTDWVLQNGVYCAFVDPRPMRWLLQFASPQEAQFFTLIANLAKIDKMYCFADSNGEQSSRDVVVSNQTYDLSQLKIETAPVDEKTITLDTEGKIGASYFIKESESTFSIVTIISNSATPAASATSVTSVSSEAGEVPKQQESSGLHEEPQKTQIKDATEDLPENSSSVSASVSSAVSSREDEKNPMDEINREMEKRFDELFTEIAQLKRYGVVSSQSNVLINSVQNLIYQNQQKEQLIKEKRKLIDLLEERKSDTTERDQLRAELSKLSAQLSEKQEEMKRRAESRDSIQKEIEQVNRELQKAQIDAANQIELLKSKLNDEKNSQISELKNIEKTLTESLESKKAEYQKNLDEAEKLKADSLRKQKEAGSNTKEKIERLKNSIPSLTENVIRSMVTGVHQMIVDSFEEDEEYDGSLIIKAMKVALQRQAEEIVSQLD